MSLDKTYLEYPERRYGMDHDRYTWSMLKDRKPTAWPNNNKLALWVNVNVQFFSLNQQKNAVPVPGGMTMPYPDLRHFSLRDYGNRVGIYRVFKALEKFSVTPTIAINGAMVKRAPYLMDLIKERGHEVIAHGWQMDNLHSGDIAREEESERIKKTRDALESQFDKTIEGWLSPGRFQTAHTPDLLAEQAFTYVCDWINDDMPYPFKTASGDITTMPLSNELDDFFILNSNLHSAESYAEQLADACDFLLEEATQQGGRLLALNVHPWLLGQPHRIAQLENALEHITSKSGVFSASAGEILKIWKAQL